MVYGDFKDSPRRKAADKVFCDKAFNIVKNHRYDGYQRGLASAVYRFFKKRPLHLQINLLQVVLLKMKSCTIRN